VFPVTLLGLVIFLVLAEVAVVWHPMISLILVQGATLVRTAVQEVALGGLTLEQLGLPEMVFHQLGTMAEMRLMTPEVAVGALGQQAQTPQALRGAMAEMVRPRLLPARLLLAEAEAVGVVVLLQAQGEQVAEALEQLQLQQTAEPILEVVAVGFTVPATPLGLLAVQVL
jgi:hypothetical protein